MLSLYTQQNYCRHNSQYFKDPSNYLDAPAVIFFFLIVPFRVIGMNVQWVFASLFYIFHGLKALKFAAAHK